MLSPSVIEKEKRDAHVESPGKWVGIVILIYILPSRTALT